MKPLTLLQLPSGETYGTTLEGPADMTYRLRAAGHIVQRIGNVVRLVRIATVWTTDPGEFQGNWGHALGILETLDKKGGAG